MRSIWTNLHNIMLKLCLNPNYKQVFRWAFTKHWFNPKSLCALLCPRVILGSVQNKPRSREKKNNHQVCVGKGIQHVFYDVLNSVIDFMMMKRCHMPTSLTCIEVMAHVRGGNAIKWWNITNAILYIGLMTWCHESFTPWKKTQLKQAKKSILCK